MFGQKKQSPISTEQALSARPVRAVEADVQPANDGGVKLRVPLAQPRWGKWLFRLPSGSTKTFELDAVGAFVWENIDGKSSVQQIIQRLSKEYNLNLREAQVPTIKFLQMLMKKGLVAISLEKDKKATT